MAEGLTGCRIRRSNDIWIRVGWPVGQVAVLISILLLGACQSGPGESDGVVSGEPLSVQLDHHLSLVLDDSETGFHEVRGAVVLESGRTYVVANAGDGTLRWFDSTGVLQRTVGGSGEGPGEFRSLDGLFRLGADALVAYDGRLRRATVFSRAGELRRTVSIDEEHLDIGTPRLRGTAGEGELVWSAPRRSTGAAAERRWVDAEAVFTTDLDGQVMTDFGTFPGREWYRIPTSRLARGDVPFTGELAVASRGDYIVAGNTRSALLDVFDPTGMQLGSIRWHSPGLPLSDRMIEEDREAKEEHYGASGRTPLAMARLASVDEVPYPDSLPAFSAILMGPVGEVWVAEYRSPSANRGRPYHSGRHTVGSRWSLVGLSGVVRAEAEFDERFLPLWMESDVVVGIQRDDLGVESVEVLHTRLPGAER